MMATASSTLAGRRVALTGSTGFVGSQVLHLLLQQGAHVTALVREKVDPRLAGLARAVAGLPGGVQFVEADILSQASVTDALRGTDYVVHVASPFVIAAEDPANDIIKPAVEGTANVLRAAAAHKGTVQRVVVTSSVCAIHDCHAKQPPKGALYTEEDWNTVSTPEAEPYWVSKVEAERAAWRLADELGLQLVTILPNFVMGPVLCADVVGGLSIGFMKGFVEGSASSPVPSGSWIFSDVCDVAAAHVAALTAPAAAGQRYIVSHPASASAKDVTDILKASDLGLAHIPDGGPEPERRNIDGTKVVRDLGVAYRPMGESITDMARSLMALRIATPAAQA